MAPNDFGKVLVEDCERLSISTLPAVSEVVVGNTNIALTTTPVHFGGVRPWFLCSHCERRIGVLLIHPSGEVGCRKCLNASYRACRFKGMVENEYA